MLGVVGADELVTAVRFCVDSAFAERVDVYAEAKGNHAETRMSVLIQQLVPAEAAGVAFTANPVTGDRDEVLINVVPGLGDRLVAGEATPDQWSVRDGVATRTHTAEDAITAEQALAVAELARRVEAYFGAPQDVEWAIAGGVSWLVQARPITALPEFLADAAPAPVEPPPGVWERSNYAPEPLSPMFRSLMLPDLHELTVNLFPYSIGDKIEFCELGGWLYAQFVPVKDPERIKAKLGRAVAAARADEPSTFYRRWYGVTEPKLTQWIAELRDNRQLPAMTDDELAEHLDETMAVWRESLTAHFQTGGSGTFVLGELGVAARDLLDWDAPETLNLLLGLQGKTTEPSYRLAELVERVRERAELRETVERLADAEPGDDLVGELAAVDPGFAEAFVAYQREYGHRTLGMDITEPTVAERPGLVLNLVRGQLDQNFDPAADRVALVRERTRAETAARAALVDHPEEDRDRFERLLGRAQWAAPARDDSHYLTQLAGGLLRRAVLEFGVRLVDGGLLADRDDVFLLERAEVEAALRDGVDQRGLAGDRRAERAWALAHPGPKAYGAAPQGGGDIGARMASLPPEARRILEIGLWAWREVSGERAHGTGAATDGDGSVLHGIAGSRGRYTGPVRVIRTEADFDRLRPGDVLVCPETNPQWAVLFPSVGALVTDHGGLLSHPAIIAREYRVPAVLATGNATSRLHDGQVVTVDGSSGVVELVNP